jgi:hypothetical protein
MFYKVIDYFGAIYTLNQVIQMIAKSRERLDELSTASPRQKAEAREDMSRLELLAELRRVIRNEDQSDHSEAELDALRFIVNSMARFYRRPWQIVRQTLSFIAAMVLVLIVLTHPGASKEFQVPLYYMFAGLIVGSELVMFIYRIIMDDALLKGEKLLAEARESLVSV